MTGKPGSSFQREADDSGNVYALTPEGRKPVGTMVTPQHAQEAAEAHNERLAAWQAAKRGVNLHGAVGVQIGDGGYQNNVF